MRPKAITILCIVLFILQGLALAGAGQGLLIALGIVEFSGNAGSSEISQAVSNLSVVEALYGFLASLASLVSVYGLWAMKKWGVYLFLLVVLLGVFITYVISPPWVVQSPLGWWVPFILPAIYLAVVLPYWGRLSGAAANDDAQV